MGQLVTRFMMMLPLRTYTVFSPKIFSLYTFILSNQVKTSLVSPLYTRSGFTNLCSKDRLFRKRERVQKMFILPSLRGRGSSIQNPPQSPPREELDFTWTLDAKWVGYGLKCCPCMSKEGLDFYVQLGLSHGETS